MADYTRFSSRASLAVIGVLTRKLGLWRVIEQHVHIRQKVIKHRPIDKLLDAFINIVAGGHGLNEINTRVRSDPAVQRAFGRVDCAEQSVVSDTLNASTAENVVQMRQALQELYRSHSQGYVHDYDSAWQVLDADMTGMPAGRQGEGVTKGFFSDKKNRRGRQLGRVVATLYDEIVTERLYDGKTQLQSSLQSLVLAAEQVLDLGEERRRRTICASMAAGARMRTSTGSCVAAMLFWAKSRTGSVPRNSRARSILGTPTPKPATDMSAGSKNHTSMNILHANWPCAHPRRTARGAIG